jgi:hypothetical protein
VDRNVSASFLMAGFGIKRYESSGSATTGSVSFSDYDVRG